MRQVARNAKQVGAMWKRQKKEETNRERYIITTNSSYEKRHMRIYNKVIIVKFGHGSMRVAKRNSDTATKKKPVTRDPKLRPVATKKPQ